MKMLVFFSSFFYKRISNLQENMRTKNGRRWEIFPAKYIMQMHAHTFFFPFAYMFSYAMLQEGTGRQTDGREKPDIIFHDLPRYNISATECSSYQGWDFYNLSSPSLVRAWRKVIAIVTRAGRWKQVSSSLHRLYYHRGPYRHRCRLLSVLKMLNLHTSCMRMKPLVSRIMLLVFFFPLLLFLRCGPGALRLSS